MSPCFRCENYASLALGDMDCDEHTGKGEQVYIYTYIMHNASMQSKKVNAYIPRTWPKI